MKRGLEIACNPGDDFWVNDRQYIIDRIASPIEFSVRRVSDGTVFDIKDDNVGQEVDTKICIKSAYAAREG